MEDACKNEDKHEMTKEVESLQKLEDNKQVDTSTMSGCNENVDNINIQQEASSSQPKTESIEQLKNQLEMVMNSLAILSAEKSKMEATFQMDKKHLRSERDECEKTIKELKEKLKKHQSHNMSEMEHVKCKLIMERHEREKERANHAATIKELQKALNDEYRNKEQLETQLKHLFANKTQCKILEAELEITKNKLKQAEEAAKETPPLLVSLQSEMAAMKKQHRYAIQEEQKRAAAAEQQTKVLSMTHEARVASLESRLAELSEIVGEYDRLRQQDQRSIQKLKDQLLILQEAEHKECIKITNEPEEIITKIKTLYNRLLHLDNKRNSAYMKSLLNTLDLCNNCPHYEYKEKYESLSQELKAYKEQISTKYNIETNMLYTNQKQTNDVVEDQAKDNHKTQLQLLRIHNNNLEERIRILNSKLTQREKELQTKIDNQKQLLEQERTKSEQILLQKEHEFRSKISNLEQQLLRQRERSVALVQEKDKEILMLKTSFHALIGNKDSLQPESKTCASKHESKIEPTNELMSGLLTKDSTPLLHYTQELARKEVQISTSRRKILELEASLREKERFLLHINEKHKEESKILNERIVKLEACKSRESANLEYLKNVVINYLTTSDTASKRHMLNAISTVLQFTTDELEKVNRVK